MIAVFQLILMILLCKQLVKTHRQEMQTLIQIHTLIQKNPIQLLVGRETDFSSSSVLRPDSVDRYRTPRSSRSASSCSGGICFSSNSGRCIDVTVTLQHCSPDRSTINSEGNRVSTGWKGCVSRGKECKKTNNHKINNHKTK